MTTLLLTRREIQALMTTEDYLNAVAEGFAALTEGRASMPLPLHVAVDQGGFHAKAAFLRGRRSYVALKLNANMPSNAARLGLPTIQGVILLHDGDTGQPLAVMDSIEVTLRRTAAATALAARYLARPDSAVLAVCGCGAQALPHVDALMTVLPLRRVVLWDLDAARAEWMRQRLSGRHQLDVRVAATLPEATQGSDVVVTCTTSREAFLELAAVKPGVFIAAVGADARTKSEIAPALMAAAIVVVDSLAQCLEMGDLRHAVAAGAMSADQVHAELGELVCGTKPGRGRADEICIFDSTGVAIQDVASVAQVFERASERGVGTRIELSSE